MVRLPAGSLALLALIGVSLLAACARSPQVHGGPIVLITLNGLRADVVSSLNRGSGGVDSGLTPNLDRLVRSADWAGRAIAPSSRVVPSTAALLTGLRPWQSQVLRQESPDLPPDLLTLPEALKAVGYGTHGYYSGHWMESKTGYDQGFDSYNLLGEGDEAIERLSRLSADREMVYAHISEPQPPYVRRAWLLARVRDLSPGLPPQVRAAELARYADPTVPLPPEAAAATGTSIGCTSPGPTRSSAACSTPSGRAASGTAPS